MTKPSLVPRPCPAPVFDRLQSTKTEGEGIDIIEIIEAFYLCFCILQAIKNWARRGLGTRLDQTRAIANSVDMVVTLMHVARGDLLPEVVDKRQRSSVEIRKSTSEVQLCPASFPKAS